MKKKMKKYYCVYDCEGFGDYNPETDTYNKIYNGFCYIEAETKEEAEAIVNERNAADPYSRGKGVWAEAFEVSEAEYRQMTREAI